MMEAGSSADMAVPLAWSFVMYAVAEVLFVKVISIVSEDLLTEMPMDALTLVPEPSAAVFPSISVVTAVVVHNATPLAELAEAEVG